MVKLEEFVWSLTMFLKAQFLKVWFFDKPWRKLITTPYHIVAEEVPSPTKDETNLDWKLHLDPLDKNIWAVAASYANNLVRAKVYALGKDKHSMFQEDTHPI